MLLADRACRLADGRIGAVARFAVGVEGVFRREAECGRLDGRVKLLVFAIPVVAVFSVVAWRPALHFPGPRVVIRRRLAVLLIIPATSTANKLFLLLQHILQPLLVVPEPTLFLPRHFEYLLKFPDLIDEVLVAVAAE